MSAPPTDWLPAELLAAYATSIVRAFGGAAQLDTPANVRARATVRDRVRATLASVRPHPAGPSLAEAITELQEDARRGFPDRTSAARRLAELAALFEQAAFRRTKRAERARLFAQLIVLFQLEPAAGLVVLDWTRVEPEEHLKSVKRHLSRRRT